MESEFLPSSFWKMPKRFLFMLKLICLDACVCVCACVVVVVQ